MAARNTSRSCCSRRTRPIVVSLSSERGGVTSARRLLGITSAVAVLTVQSPPEITAQPQGGFALLGGRITLRVSATGDAPLAYQWRFNGTNLAGATELTLALSNLQETDSGAYTVRVTNVAGGALSDAAVLTVVEAPALERPGFTAEAEFAAVLTGPTNRTYAIEVSTNLTDWVELGTVTHTNGATPVVDPAAADSTRRYYRARLGE